MVAKIAKHIEIEQYNGFVFVLLWKDIIYTFPNESGSFL
jgi:hypothetical protein